jgi:hypothetical protein
MTRSPDHPSIKIEDDGRLLALADVEAPDEEGVAHSALHVESGHLPGGTRTRLVDAVLDSPEVEGAERLVASMPAGDTEMLDRVRERADGVEVRATGATNLVEARLEDEHDDRPTTGSRPTPRRRR